MHSLFIGCTDISYHQLIIYTWMYYKKVQLHIFKLSGGMNHELTVQMVEEKIYSDISREA